MSSLSNTSYLEQVRRLRQLAVIVLGSFPVREPRLYFINHGENTTFRVEAKNGSRFLLRIHRLGYHTPGAMKEEIEWLLRLSKSDLIHAPVPVRSKHGSFLEKATTLAIPEGRYCDLLEWVEGKFIFKSATPKHLFRLGQLMAHLHRSTRGRPVAHRRYWDAQGLVGPKPKFGSIESIPGLARGKQSLLMKGRQEIFARLRAFERRFPERQGLIHADLHFGNFLMRDGYPAAIDFDDCGLGFYAYDLAIPLTHLSYLCEKNPKKSFLALAASLQNGYASLSPWDKHDVEALPYLYTARQLSMVGWLNSRSDNPELKKRVLTAADRVAKRLKTDWREFR